MNEQEIFPERKITPIMCCFEMSVHFPAIVQPAIIKEKITKHQPIPIVIFRLCCPPGMIPLTAKVAERLGINITMTNQQIK